MANGRRGVQIGIAGHTGHEVMQQIRIVFFGLFYLNPCLVDPLCSWITL